MDLIILPCCKFNSGLAKPLLKLGHGGVIISHRKVIMSHWKVITYACFSLALISVSKRGPWSPILFPLTHQWGGANKMCNNCNMICFLHTCQSTYICCNCTTDSLRPCMIMGCFWFSVDVMHIDLLKCKLWPTEETYCCVYIMYVIVTLFCCFGRATF